MRPQVLGSAGGTGGGANAVAPAGPKCPRVAEHQQAIVLPPTVELDAVEALVERLAAQKRHCTVTHGMVRYTLRNGTWSAAAASGRAEAP